MAPVLLSLTSGTAATYWENGSEAAYTITATSNYPTLTYAISGTDAALFSINSTTGAVTFKTAPDFEAPADSGADNIYDITVSASAASLRTVSQAVTITVGNVNEAPVVTSGAAVSLAENGTGTVYTATASDPDAGTTLSYALGGADAALFDIDATSGVVTFKAAPDYEAPADTGADNVYDITVGASDGTLHASRAVAITVTDANEAPAVISGATVSLAENGTGTVYTATASDPDAGTTLSFTLGGTDAALFDIDATSGIVTFKAAPDYEAPADTGADNIYDITVGASDGTLHASRAVAITVTDANEAPTVTSAALVTFAENGTGTVYTATASDPDAGATLSYTLGGADAALFDIDATSGVVTFKAAPDYEAPADAGADNVYDVTVIASDGALSGSLALAVVVTGVSEQPPVITSTATADVAENSTGAVYVGTASDADAGSTLTWTLGGTDAALFLIDSNSGAVTFRTAPDFETPADHGGDNIYDITVSASDGTFDDSLDVAITVTDVNEAPRISYLALATNPFDGIDVGTDSAPSFVDLTGDGRLDLVAGSKYGTLSAYQNTGTGFTAFGTNPFDGIDVGDSSTPSFVDLDGDGDLDLVVGSHGGFSGSSSPLRAFENTGAGFAAFVTDPLGGMTVGKRGTPSFADLDGDGGTDLVVGGKYGTLSAYENTGSVFTPFATNPFAGIAVGDRSAPAFVDLDADGRLDLVVGNGAGLVQAWRNTGTGFTAFDVNPFGSIDAGSNATPAFVDLTGDGIPDLVLGNSDGTFQVYRTASASVAENTGGTVYTPIATDHDAGTTLTWSLSGTDAALFTIDSATGAVSFKARPDFEAPADAGADNAYGIIVTVSDGALADSRAVIISVTDAIDVVTGTARADSLTGAAGADSMAGGGGNDSISGGDGKDTLNGQGGADLLDGGAGDDVLWGGAGADRLNGGLGSDTLAGGFDGDTLTGGQGRDVLFGGDGADVFRYLALGETSTGQVDVIRDFAPGQDLIDLSAIDADASLPGDQAFTWRGSQTFTGAGHEVRFVKDVAHAVTRVLIDSDGDRVAEASIILNGAMSLAASNFML